MKVVVVLAVLLTGLSCAAQRLTLRGNGLAIADVLCEIRRQTGYAVIFSPSILSDAPPVDLNCRDADVRQVLQSCFAGLQLGYTIIDRSIVLSRKVGLEDCLYLPLRGRVQGPGGEPLAGASVIAYDGLRDGDAIRLYTGADGCFRIPVRRLRAMVTICCTGYAPRTLCLSNTEVQTVSMTPAAVTLDNVIVQAYGKTTFRLSTGTISQVSAAELGSTAGGNVLETLEGRLPGMTIRQYNGVPGSAYGVLVRGRHSISQGTDPLIVVDGVPLPDNNDLLSTIGSGSAQGPLGASVLNGIPMSAIASVEVLKDAAATAIYGSRGANGVVLLTLKTGSAGRLKWDAEVSSGVDAAVKTSPLLNTSQYLALRKEAVMNDGLPVDSATVPEAFAWDSNRYTNFKKEVSGNTGFRRYARIDVMGGDTNTVFLLSGSDRHETAVFPGATGDDRISLYGHLAHTSANRRLRLELSALFNWEGNRLPVQDYTPFEWLAPNAPAFTNASGQPAWNSNGLSFLNIPAQEHNVYQASGGNTLGHLQLGYRLLPGLSISGSLGFSYVGADERSEWSVEGQDPATHPGSVSYHTVNSGVSELIEGMADYSRIRGRNRLEALFGGTWQQQAGEYSQAATGAPDYSNRVVYRYEAAFGRVVYTWKDRLIASVSGRRDGSSRFGPGNQFGNFGAIGAAWIFSEEKAFKKWPWLSFGKLRGSLGTTGNDPIDANSYVQTWLGTGPARGYQGTQGVYPASFASPGLRWEVNYNSELAADLGFLNNRIMLSVAAFHDWTGNQLLYDLLPAQAGEPGVLLNMPVTVVNEGLEFSLQTYNISTPNFRWSSLLTLTAPVNWLARFPNLSGSLYASTLVPGRSLSVVKGYRYEGVDPRSGLFQFRDVNHDGILDYGDLQAGGNLDPRYYGGCNQSIRYKRWQLDLFFEFRVQNGYNPFVVLYENHPPGSPAFESLGNGPAGWLDHWRQPGDRARLQRLTASPVSAAAAAIQNYIHSSAQVTGASYIRWKSLSLSWRLPASLLSGLRLREGQVWLRGQNLLTYTHFPVTDPETQDPGVLPPVRSLGAGVGLKF